MKSLKIILILLVIPFACVSAQFCKRASATGPLDDTLEHYTSGSRTDCRVADTEILSFKLKEEPYVCDIPFNTTQIASDVKVRNMIAETAEKQVDDIPFDTKKVFCTAIMCKYVAEWEDEEDVDDFPYDTYYLANCHEVVLKNAVYCNTLLCIVSRSIHSQGVVFKEILAYAEAYLDEEGNSMNPPPGVNRALRHGPNPAVYFESILQANERSGGNLSKIKSVLDTLDFIDALISRVMLKNMNSTRSIF